MKPLSSGVSFVCGFLFACGLALAGMTSPTKVIGFLDISGHWDPSLALVMIGAISVFGAAYWWSHSLSHPRLEPAFQHPKPKRLDTRLIGGSALFGIGWGISGYCPGPALVTAASGAPQAVLFTLAMLTGLWGTELLVKKLLARPAQQDATPSHS